MLYVQNEWGVSGPSSSPLRGFTRSMERYLQSLQSVLGYASLGGRFIRLLVDGWSLSECGHVEDGPLLPFIVPVEGT
jgi:hypothetical protein